MKRNAIIFSCTVMFASCFSGSARAGVTGYGVGYYVGGEQLSDDEPVNGLFYLYGASITASLENDLFAGTLTAPNGTHILSPTGTTNLSYGENHTSLANLLAAYPAGDYDFDITAGNAGPASATLAVPESDMPIETPYLINGSWSALQYAPAGIPAPIEWFSFTFPGTTESHDTALYVDDYTVPALVLANNGNYEVYQSDVIPGAVMKSGHNFAYTLYYQSYTQLAGQGFGGAYSSVSYIRYTSGYFHVKADIGTVSGRIILGDYPDPAGESIDVEMLGPGGVEETRTITLGQFGYYAFDTDVRGPKTVTFKGRHWLRKGGVADLDFGQDTLDFTLPNGDVDGDNEVSIGDYSILSFAFNSFPGDPNWFAEADLNGDGTVDIGDFSILSANFGEVGD